jgi:hypothetical protein
MAVATPLGAGAVILCARRQDGRWLSRPGEAGNASGR